MPFTGENVNEVMLNIHEKPLSFESEIWQYISDDGRNFVENLLLKDPSERFSAAQALQHDWFSEFSSDSMEDLDLQILMRLRGYRGVSFLKKQAMEILISVVKPAEISYLKNQF